eukprot:3108856-Amphidinium_carterae.1
MLPVTMRHVVGIQSCCGITCVMRKCERFFDLMHVNVWQRFPLLYVVMVVRREVPLNTVYRGMLALEVIGVTESQCNGMTEFRQLLDCSMWELCSAPKSLQLTHLHLNVTGCTGTAWCALEDFALKSRALAGTSVHSSSAKTHVIFGMRVELRQGQTIVSSIV